MNPLFHVKTKQHVADFIARPSHALLIAGPPGAGKGFTAQYIASQLLQIPAEKIFGHPYVQWLRDNEKAVSIEQVRNAQNFMQLRVPGSRAVRRILIVEQGETMGHEAQNAFLKLLEEPPKDSVIIITTTSIDRILPTIRSRAQLLTILPPAQIDIQEHFTGNFSPNAITKAFHLSEGYMGLLQALLSDDNKHPLVQQITVAKKILGESLYQRLCAVESIIKSKNVQLFLQAMERVCHAALLNSIAKTNTVGHDNQNIVLTKRWSQRLRAIITAQKDVQSSVQGKLLLTQLMLDL